MTLTDRINRSPQRLPDNVVPMRDRPEKRSKPRWMERMDQQGLPVQDATWKATREAA